MQVVESEEFLLLPVNQLVDIISSDELNVRSEEQVFGAAMAWVRYNMTDRRIHLPMVTIIHFTSNSTMLNNFKWKCSLGSCRNNTIILNLCFTSL